MPGSRHLGGFNEEYGGVGSLSSVVARRVEAFRKISRLRKFAIDTQLFLSDEYHQDKVTIQVTCKLVSSFKVLGTTPNNKYSLYDSSIKHITSKCNFQRRPKSVLLIQYLEALLIPEQERIGKVIDLSRVAIH